MNRALSAITSGLLFLAALVAAPSPAYAQRAVLEAPKKAVVTKGPRLSTLRHRYVWNHRGERIGTIADFTISNEDRLFAVLQVGGFLGVGGYLVAVPFKILVVNEAGRKILLAGATREALQNFPEFRFDD